MNFFKELFIFFKIKKKLWMLPIVIIIVLLGGALVLSQGSVVAPFLYTLF